MRPGRAQIRPLGAWPGCLLMILFSVSPRSWAPCCSICCDHPRPPTIPSHCWQRWRQEMGTATKRRARQLAPVTVAAAPGRRLGAAPWSRAAGRPAEAMVSRRPRPQRRVRGFAAATPPGAHGRAIPARPRLGAPGAILGAEGWFTEWHEGQSASVGGRQTTAAFGRGPASLQHGPPALSWRSL